MSFNSDKKKEHEQLAEKALAQRDYAKAFFHTAKAADYGFNLAEQSEGRLAKAYLQDASELLDIAAKLKEKARAEPSSANKPAKLSEKDTTGGGDEGVPDAENLASQWQLSERPDIKLDDVAGLDEVKDALREDVICAFNHPEVYERFKVEGGGGVLMYGPPGNGKTFIAKAIAGELDAAFFTVDASQIKDKYVGETEKNMRRLFEEARQNKRAVIFFDEIDALLQKRGRQKVNAVTQFLVLADGVASNPGDCMLLLLGATNKPWSVDPAALRPGRFGKQIYVGLPDSTAREAIIKYCLREVPFEDGFPFDEIAERTEGFSGADMAEMCRRAKKKAILRQIDSGQDEVVTADDIQTIVRNLSQSVSAEQLIEYEKWRDSHAPDTDEGEEDAD
jgi:transitional endoplasmic reticulum ATPase